MRTKIEKTNFRLNEGKGTIWSGDFNYVLDKLDEIIDFLSPHSTGESEDNFEKEFPYVAKSIIHTSFSSAPKEEWEEKISAESKQLLVDYSTSPKLEFYMNLRFKELFRTLLASSLHSEKDRMRVGVENIRPAQIAHSGGEYWIRKDDVLGLIDNRDK